MHKLRHLKPAEERRVCAILSLHRQKHLRKGENGKVRLLYGGHDAEVQPYGLLPQSVWFLLDKRVTMEIQQGRVRQNHPFASFGL